MFNLQDLSVDEILQHIVTLRQDESERRFILGELCEYAISRGIKANEIASYINCTEGYIRQLIKVYTAFPGEEDRIPYAEQTYMHFKLAAYTERPKYWLDLAAENGWSTRELGKAIRGEAVVDELQTADRILGSVERCIDAGGKGALYLYDQLSGYLGRVARDQLLRADPEAEEAEEEETVSL